jgi:hypothetical protein
MEGNPLAGFDDQVSLNMLAVKLNKPAVWVRKKIILGIKVFILLVAKMATAVNQASLN